MKIFLPLITAVIIFISYFSVGLPIKALTASDWPTPSHYPLPLSFPFYSVDKPDPEVSIFQLESYELYFLNYRIMNYQHYYALSSDHIYHWLFVHYFLLINIVGAVLGFGLSRAKSIWRYFARRKPETEKTWKKIRGILLAVMILISAFVIFSVVWSCRCIEVKARIVRKGGIFPVGPPPFFYLDNGERVTVSYDDYIEYQEGDLFTYRKSLSEIHTPRCDSEFSLRNMPLIGIVALIVLTIFLGLSSIAPKIQNEEQSKEVVDSETEMIEFVP